MFGSAQNLASPPKQQSSVEAGTEIEAAAALLQPPKEKQPSRRDHSSVDVPLLEQAEPGASGAAEDSGSSANCAVQTTGATAEQRYSEPNRTERQNRRSNHLWKIVAAVLFVLVLALILGCIFRKPHTVAAVAATAPDTTSATVSHSTLTQAVATTATSVRPSQSLIKLQLDVSKLPTCEAEGAPLCADRSARVRMRLTTHSKQLLAPLKCAAASHGTDNCSLTSSTYRLTNNASSIEVLVTGKYAAIIQIRGTCSHDVKDAQQVTASLNVNENAQETQDSINCQNGQEFSLHLSTKLRLQAGDRLSVALMPVNSGVGSGISSTTLLLSAMHSATFVQLDEQ